MAESIGIARPYADAVFQLARESGQLQGWADVLHAAASVVADADMAKFIDSPHTDAAQVAGIVAAVVRQAIGSAVDAGQLDNLLGLLAENRRLPAIADIGALFDKLKAEVENSVDVVLTAAAPVDAAQRDRIVAALRQRFGRDINLHFELDENLIGGARLQADDLIIDGSIRTGLDKMASALTN
ncbi:MAG: F0F1 ATP synthase subunit delta [Gammaproteobacteria bacterium]